MSHSFFTAAEKSVLLSNGRFGASGADHDPFPVVKLFTPDGNATWLISEIDPVDLDRFFGLCDLGLGCPELGYGSLAELFDLRGRLRLPVERDLYFVADRPLSAYAIEANAAGRIVS